MANDTFQSNKKCPECGKRKVYIIPTEDGYEYICTACGHTWSV